MHRKKERVLGGAVVLAVAAMAGAQPTVSVDLRIVPRLGSTSIVAGYEPLFDLAVQARVNSAGNTYGLAGFSFDIRLVNEPESAGTLWRAGTSLADGTYDPSLRTYNRIGMGGLAQQFSYLAFLNPSFNGVMNLSEGSFTNGPDQEIGLVAGTSRALQLLSTPGVDDDQDGTPDSNPPAPAVMRSYFGAGEFVDVYRFRYAARYNTGRTFDFELVNPTSVQVFETLAYANRTWAPTGLVSVTGDSLHVSGLGVRALPSPGIGMAAAGAGFLWARRRRQ